MQPDIPFLPVFSSMKRLIRYSLGSVALGSLTVSFVESIRFILESIRRKLKVYNIMPESQVGKVAFYSTQGLRKSIEWTIKSVNRNAYIMVILKNLFVTSVHVCCLCACALYFQLLGSHSSFTGEINLINTKDKKQCNPQHFPPCGRHTKRDQFRSRGPPLEDHIIWF